MQKESDRLLSSLVHAQTVVEQELTSQIVRIEETTREQQAGEEERDILAQEYQLLTNQYEALSREFLQNKQLQLDEKAEWQRRCLDLTKLLEKHHIDIPSSHMDSGQLARSLSQTEATQAPEGPDGRLSLRTSHRLSTRATPTPTPPPPSGLFSPKSLEQVLAISPRRASYNPAAAAASSPSPAATLSATAAAAGTGAGAGAANPLLHHRHISLGQIDEQPPTAAATAPTLTVTLSPTASSSQLRKRSLSPTALAALSPAAALVRSLSPGASALTTTSAASSTPATSTSPSSAAAAAAAAVAAAASPDGRRASLVLSPLPTLASAANAVVTFAQTVQAATRTNSLLAATVNKGDRRASLAGLDEVTMTSIREARATLAAVPVQIGLVFVQPPQPQSGSAVSGVLVTSVSEGGSAHRAGVQVGDIIRCVHSQWIGNKQAFLNALRTLTPGDTIPMLVWRPGPKANGPAAAAGAADPAAAEGEEVLINVVLAARGMDDAALAELRQRAHQPPRTHAHQPPPPPAIQLS